MRPPFPSVLRILPPTLQWLWRGWAFIASLFLLFALWEGLARFYSDLILPSPRAAFAELARLAGEGVVLEQLQITGKRALAGFALAVGIGGVLGCLAGASLTATYLLRPVISVLIGTPPVAWLVLALLWFGATDGTPVFTVFIACFPPVFLAGLQGTRTLDGPLKSMAAAFRLPWHMRLKDLYFPHVVSYLIPAMTTALGGSWKVAVMAELLAASDGIGAALATSRSLLDTQATFAWILTLVLVLLLVESLLFEPFRQWVEKWRRIQ